MTENNKTGTARSAGLLPGKNLLGGLTLCCAFLSACTGQDTYPATDNEKAMAQAIFGDRISTKALKHRFAVQRLSNPLTDEPMAAQVFDGETIHFYIRDYISSDYAGAGTQQFARLLYIHELTHIAQFQAKMNFSHCRSGQDKTYFYTIAPDAKFDDYCVEQQASMMQDYAGLYLFDEKETPFFMKGPKDEAAHKMLRAMVEDAFPAARKTRLSGGIKLAATPVLYINDQSITQTPSGPVPSIGMIFR